jgi:uncharacterized protein (TIGR02266 family)
MEPFSSVAPPEDLTKVGRRAHERAPLEVEVTIESDHNFFNGFSENVSEGGLFVATHMPLPVGRTLEVEFTLPDVSRKLHVTCVVCWIRPYGETIDLPAGMGVRFVDLAPADADLIAAFVRRREPIFYD